MNGYAMSALVVAGLAAFTGLCWLAAIFPWAGIGVLIYVWFVLGWLWEHP